MNIRDIERKKEVIDALKERKHERDLQAAMMGISADPSVILEQRKLEQQIQKLEDELILIQQKYHRTNATHVYEQEDSKVELDQSSSKSNILISYTKDNTKQPSIKVSTRKGNSELQEDSLLVNFIIKPVFMFIYKCVDFYHNTQAYEKRILEITNDKHPVVAIIFRCIFGIIGFIIGVLILIPIYVKLEPSNQNDSGGFLVILVCGPLAYIGYLIGNILGYRLHKLYYYLKQQWYE